MEIHIQLAGVKLGPYSERQVREYLSEGLLSLSDPARHEGVENWETVREVLAKAPPPSSSPEKTVAEPVPPALVETKVPESVSVKAPEPVSTPVVPESVPVGVDSRPSPVTSPAKARETVNIPQPLVVKSLAKKTGQGTKTSTSISLLPPVSSPAESAKTTAAPTATPPPLSSVTPAKITGLVSPLLPAPVKIELKKPDPAPVADPVTTESATSPALPLAATKAPEAIPAVSPEPVKILLKSTGPVTPAPPESPSDPTSRQLPSAVRILAKKMDRSARATALIPAVVEPISAPATPPPADVTPPDKAPGAGTVPASVKIIPKKAGAAALAAAARQLSAPVVESPPTAPVVPAVPLIPSEKVETIPPRKRGPFPPRAYKRFIPVALGIFGLLMLLPLFYLWSPYHSATLLRDALNNGNQEQLESTIDFPALRASFKQQMDAQLNKAPATSDTDASAPTDAASTAALTMIDNSIDFYVTPTGIPGLVNKAGPTPTADQPQVVAPEVASGILFNLTSLPVKSQRLVSLGDFVIDLDVAKLHLQFYGPGWKLNRIDLKHDLHLPPLVPSSTSPATPPAPAASPTPSSSLVSPVVETYIDQGKAAYQKRDWAGAIAAFSQVLSINPKMIPAYFNRGMARQAKGDLDGAIDDYNQAITLDPKLADAYYNRGEAKAAKQDVDGSIDDDTAAIALDPKMAGAYYSRGNARTTKGDFDAAIADYTQVLSLDPNQASAYSNRGYAKQAKNDLDGAIADYTQALAIDPKIAIAYYNRGLVRHAQGNLDAAILDYNQALDLDPKLAGTYYNRGNAKNSKHDLDGAIADYNQALALDPKIALAYCNRGLAKQAKGDLNGALADYTQTLALDPTIAVAYYNRGLIKEQNNDLDGSIADSSQALALDPKEAQAYYNRGFAKLTKGNLEGAAADLRQFCKLAPRDHYADHARLYLWLIAKAQNSKTDPDQELSDSIENDWNSSPEDPVSKLAGFLLGHITEPELIAGASSSDVKKDQGQHCEVWYFAGMKRLLAGDRETAADYFRKCVATGEKDFCEYILAQAELHALQPPAK